MLSPMALGTANVSYIFFEMVTFDSYWTIFYFGGIIHTLPLTMFPDLPCQLVSYIDCTGICFFCLGHHPHVAAYHVSGRNTLFILVVFGTFIRYRRQTFRTERIHLKVLAVSCTIDSRGDVGLYMRRRAYVYIVRMSASLRRYPVKLTAS